MNDGKGVIIMQNQNPNRYQTNRPPYVRVNQQAYYGKKKNSWIDKFNLAFNIFFVLCIGSMIISILTIVFNRTILKVINFIIIAVALMIAFSFSYTIQMLGKQISQNLHHFFLDLPPNQIITEADAIHNALILLSSSLALLFISFFFRNRHPRIK